MNSSLGLLYLASPTLPIGAFAYSQGLEKAIEDGHVFDKESLSVWCEDLMELGLAQLDLVLINELFNAINDKSTAEIEALNSKCFAVRETAELMQEEKNLGQSMARLIRTQSLTMDLIPLPKNPSLLCGFTYCGIALGLKLEEIKLAFLWSWLENQVAVACKAVPLGQSDAQAVLLGLREKVSELSNTTGEGALFGSLPNQVMTSALHETQYSRLFRS